MVQIENYIQSFLNGTLDAEGHVTLKQWIKEAPENRTSRFGGCQPYRELAEWSDDI